MQWNGNLTYHVTNKIKNSEGAIMKDIEIYTAIKDLFYTYKIGNVIEKPVSISGGLMHKLYKVRTETNVYALKWLNPSVMQRSGVVENMIQSERIASTFSSYLPVVAALNFEGQNVLQFNDMYFMVFLWMEGTSIYPPFISEKECYEIGNALGKIHHLRISIPEVKKEEVNSFDYNWQLYYEEGIEQQATWVDLYASVIDQLITWTKQVNEANVALSNDMVLSHRDLDPKNVMWNQETPYFIDWEAAGYTNPYQELLEVLNYWTEDGNGELDKDKFYTLLNAYRKYMNTATVDWACVLDSGHAGMLGWLEYNVKRALGIESKDEDERKLGEEQVIGTIAALEHYNKQKTIIQKWLSE